jgi:hypothetical protein
MMLSRTKFHSGILGWGHQNSTEIIQCNLSKERLGLGAHALESFALVSVHAKMSVRLNLCDLAATKLPQKPKYDFSASWILVENDNASSPTRQNDTKFFSLLTHALETNKFDTTKSKDNKVDFCGNSIDLSANLLNDLGLLQLSTALYTNKTLHTLSLRGVGNGVVGVTTVGFEQLAKALVAATSLTSLDISENVISPKAAAAFCSVSLFDFAIFWYCILKNLPSGLGLWLNVFLQSHIYALSLSLFLFLFFSPFLSLFLSLTLSFILMIITSQALDPKVPAEPTQPHSHHTSPKHNTPDDANDSHSSDHSGHSSLAPVTFTSSASTPTLTPPAATTPTSHSAVNRALALKHLFMSNCSLSDEGMSALVPFLSTNE